MSTSHSSLFSSSSSVSLPPPIRPPYPTTSIAVSAFNSTLESSSRPLASERWNVLKKQQELNSEIERFYNDSISKISRLEGSSNKRAVELYNEIYRKVGGGGLSKVHTRLVMEYSLSLIANEDPLGQEEKNSGVLREIAVWESRAVGTEREKLSLLVNGLYTKLYRVISKRDTQVLRSQQKLLEGAHMMSVR